MSTITKPRVKYRFSDRKAAEDAVTKLESELSFTRSLLLAHAAGAALHNVTIPDSQYRIILQTHNAITGRASYNPAMMLMDGDNPISNACDPFQWINREFSREPHYKEDSDRRELAYKMQAILNSVDE